MARQQLYYRELLRAEARPEVDALLAGVPLERKREALGVLRQLVAVTRPEMLVSHSQVSRRRLLLLLLLLCALFSVIWCVLLWCCCAVASAFTAHVCVLCVGRGRVACRILWLLARSPGKLH